MNYRDASMRGIGDFPCGDSPAQLDRARSDLRARSCFVDAEHRTDNLNFFLIIGPANYDLSSSFTPAAAQTGC